MFDEFFLIFNIMCENFCVYSIIDENDHEKDEQNYQNANHLAGFVLFEDHISELTTRLEAKGYNCKITFDMGNEPIDFVEDFMKQGQNAGVSQRLSFDVRA